MGPQHGCPRNPDGRPRALVSAVWPTAPNLCRPTGDAVKRGQRSGRSGIPYTRPMLTGNRRHLGIRGCRRTAFPGSRSSPTRQPASQRQVHRLAARTPARHRFFKPAIVIKGKDGEIAKATPAVVKPVPALTVDAILSARPGRQVSQGDVLARVPLESAKTKDITVGLRGWTELFGGSPSEGSRHSSQKSMATYPLAVRELSRTSAAS